MNSNLVELILKEDHELLVRKAARYIHKGKPGMGSITVTSHSYSSLAYETSAEWSSVVRALNAKLIDTVKRSRKMNYPIDLDIRYLCELWLRQQGRCALTGEIMTFESGSLWDKNPFGMGIDRIDNNQGYTKTNTRLLTHWANNAKSTWSEETFQKMITQSYLYQTQSQPNN